MLMEILELIPIYILKLDVSVLGIFMQLRGNMSDFFVLIHNRLFPKYRNPSAYLKLSGSRDCYDSNLFLKGLFPTRIVLYGHEGRECGGPLHEQG